MDFTKSSSYSPRHRQTKRNTNMILSRWREIAHIYMMDKPVFEKRNLPHQITRVKDNFGKYWYN